MFFVMGINQKEEELNYSPGLSIHDCGKYARVKISVTYSYMSLFFIPVFKFNKRYFASYTCCNKVYEISKDLGREIERGFNPEITDKDYIGEYSTGIFTCPNCGSEVYQGFEFCPKCGNKL
ncbi:zinc ribbon domain-containing protein [Peptoniphilus catoniae]|uniref:zinc ribbon domain-containing protein n=1 Tax=Peptoniphilus catoniae TaxID=1660341 RepID=UPI0010FE03DB|nr:zinc ribbon domain-containing protein [Peptoniphilus catoniae]